MRDLPVDLAGGTARDGRAGAGYGSVQQPLREAARPLRDAVPDRWLCSFRRRRAGDRGPPDCPLLRRSGVTRSEEHTSEPHSRMRTSSADTCMTQTTTAQRHITHEYNVKNTTNIK